MYLRHDQKDNFWPAVLIFFLILSATVFCTIKWYQEKTAVKFQGLSEETVYYADRGTRLYFQKTDTDGNQKLLNPLLPGPHMIYYETSPVTRYYARFNLERGENLIDPEFEFHSLPSLSLFRTYAGKRSLRAHDTKSFTYTTYSGTGDINRIEATIDLEMSVRKNRSRYEGRWDWSLTMNDQPVKKGHFTKVLSDDIIGSNHREVIYINGSHYYYLEFTITGKSTRMKIGAEYL